MEKKEEITSKANNVSRYNFDDIRKDGLLLYEYIRGSQAYGLALPTSDEDHGGVFIMQTDDFLGMKEYKLEEVADERHDNVWYELGKFVELLCNANPNILEALFVPERCVLYMHPLFKVFYENRDMFVTQKCFKSFVGYANEQIEKARGLKKKIVRPVNERKEVIDFCYCQDDNQGSLPVTEWLSRHGMMQRYCGLNHIPNMEGCYGVYYDFGTHIRCEYTSEDFRRRFLHPVKNRKMLESMRKYDGFSLWKYLRIMCSRDAFGKALELIQPKGYHGIMREDGASDEVRLDSLVKGDLQMRVMNYNKNGYTSHCKDYKEYQDWVKYRNPQRFKENQGKEFDRKNLCHCLRLMTMGIEIAKTGQMNVDRTDIDRDYLLNIRLGNATYDELIAIANEKKKEMAKIMEQYRLANMNHNEVEEYMRKEREEFWKDFEDGIMEKANEEGWTEEEIDNQMNVTRDMYHEAYEKYIAMKEEEIREARKVCLLPKEVNRQRLNDILIDFRKKFYQQ